LKTIWPLQGQITEYAGNKLHVVLLIDLATNIDFAAPRRKRVRASVEPSRSKIISPMTTYEETHQESQEVTMEQVSNNAHDRLRERAFTIWEEAGGDESEGFRMWHKLRPLLSRLTTQELGRAGNARTGGKASSIEIAQRG